MYLPWMPIFLVNACSIASGFGSISSFFSSGYTLWFPIIILASLAIIGIAALFYALGPLLGRNDIKVWAMAKVYDAMITIVFALIFISFATMVVCVNPVPSLASVGLVPTSCNPASGVQASPDNSNVADIFGVSLCDLYQYNQDMSQFSTAMFWVSVVFGAAPQFQMPPIGADGVYFTFLVQVLPVVIVYQYIVPYMQVYFFLSIASFLQQILLSSSMLLFSVFMIIGLIARSFGITKSFGGAMIAFALGLGVVYPLMVSMTYGFLDVVISNSAITFAGIHSTATTGGVGIPLDELGNFLVSAVAGLVSPSSWSNAHILSASAPSNIAGSVWTLVFTPLVVYGGFISLGLVFIPLLNLVVVDAFIIDFSRAVGERMDLLSLLTRIL